MSGPPTSPSTPERTENSRPVASAHVTRSPSGASVPTVTRSRGAKPGGGLARVASGHSPVTAGRAVGVGPPTTADGVDGLSDTDGVAVPCWTPQLSVVQQIARNRLTRPRESLNAGRHRRSAVDQGAGLRRHRDWPLGPARCMGPRACGRERRRSRILDPGRAQRIPRLLSLCGRLKALPGRGSAHDECQDECRDVCRDRLGARRAGR